MCAWILKVDPKLYKITPALSDPKICLAKSSVKKIAIDNIAYAGVNGTFFGKQGRPLGILMINKELISFPIYDRTALVLTDKNEAYIDNILLKSYFELPSDIRYWITGINESRGEDDIILYTPKWGKFTETDQKGIELTVINNMVTKIELGYSEIPENGYVLSVSGMALENFAQSVKVGTEIKLNLTLIPFSISKNIKIKHLIGGGPRLLKDGQLYVTKYSEKFRRDIARGRAARTAVGITADNKLLFLVAEGRPRRSRWHSRYKSVGMTLEETSKVLRMAGAVEAMNLDGGSSSSMVISNEYVNQPAGRSHIRVSNAILIGPR